MRTVVELDDEYVYIIFQLVAGRAHKIIAIDDISIAAGHCNDIDEAFPPDYGPSVCSVDDNVILPGFNWRASPLEVTDEVTEGRCCYPLRDGTALLPY